MKKTTVAATAALLLALTACSSGDDTADAIPAKPSPSVSAPACSELSGTPTDKVLKDGACLDGDTVQILASANYDCVDGRTLNWNDFGWGYSGGTWQKHDPAKSGDQDGVPPVKETAACQGT